MDTTEAFNPSSVKSVMNEIESEFSELSSLIEETNTLITNSLGSPDKAVYGDAGNKILATWDENCSTLNSFIKIYDNWSLMAVSIAHEYGELDTGTAKVEGTDVEAFKTIADANRTTWLKTPEGAKNYTGSNSVYLNPETNGMVNEHSNLNERREISYTDAEGNKITEYYNMAGELIGIKKNGKLYDANGKAVSQIGTKEELERADKVKKAQATLKESVKTKHAELKQRDKEREQRAKISKYMNPAGLSGSQLDFVESLIPGALKAYKDYGVLPSLTLAQAILESGWGEHAIGNNIFGIKAGDNWNGKTQRVQTSEQNPDGSYVSIYADFRDYDSIAESIEDHAKLLTNDRYRNVIASKDYKQACYEVRQAGYATSLEYTDNLISLVEKYGLNQWDNVNRSSINASSLTPRSVPNTGKNKFQNQRAQLDGILGNMNGYYTDDCPYVVADTLINKGVVNNNRNDYYVSGRLLADRVYGMYNNNSNYVTQNTHVAPGSNYAQAFTDFVNNKSDENIILSFNNGWGGAGAMHGHTMMVSKVQDGKVYFIDNTSLANPVNSRNGANEYVYDIDDFLRLPYFDNERQLCSITSINRV